MVTFAALWMPIVLATVLVVAASSVLWMLLPVHRSDVKGVPDEAGVMEVLRRQNLPPGQYALPYTADPGRMRDPEFARKLEAGPVGYITLIPTGRPAMGRRMLQWFLYALGVSVFVAYLTTRTLPPDADYLSVFRIAGTVAVVAYSAAIIPGAIWWGRPWRNVWKEVLDGVVYGLLTAGAFGWLWPG